MTVRARTVTHTHRHGTESLFTGGESGVSMRARNTNTHTHLQTPVTLCREQSIRGYVSKERSNVNVGRCWRARDTNTNTDQSLLPDYATKGI